MKEKQQIKPQLYGSYDPAWLVKLAREQYPHEAWLITALKESILYFMESDAYYLLSGSKPSSISTTAPQQACNIILNSQECGELVLDVAADQTITGIEFMYRITGDMHFLEKCEDIKIIVV